MSNPDKRRWITIPDAAKILETDRVAIWRLATQKRLLDTVKMKGDRQVYVSKRSVLALKRVIELKPKDKV